MATQNQNGRNVGVPDENRASYRQYDQTYRERDDDRALMPRGRMGGWMEGDEGYRSMERGRYADEGRSMERGRYVDEGRSMERGRYVDEGRSMGRGRYVEDRFGGMPRGQAHWTERADRYRGLDEPMRWGERHMYEGPEGEYLGQGEMERGYGYGFQPVHGRQGYGPGYGGYGGQGGRGGWSGVGQDQMSYGPRFGGYMPEQVGYGQRIGWYGGPESMGYGQGGYGPRIGGYGPDPQMGYGPGQMGYGRGYGSRIGGGHGYGMQGSWGYGDPRFSDQGEYGYGRQGPGQGRTGGYARDVGGWGIERGGHRGKGPLGYTRSDDRIRETVSEVLSDDDNVDASRIEVTVRGGEVTLGGTVDDRQSKRLAEDLVERVPGVKDVQNQIKVLDRRERGNQGGSQQVGKQELDQEKRHRV